MTLTQTVPIKFIAQIVSGGTPKSDAANWNGEIPFVTPPDLNGLDGALIDEWARTITKAGSSQSAITRDAVMLSCRAPIGHVGTATREVAFNQGCKAVVPDRTEDLPYLAHSLVAHRTALQAAGRGTTFTELSTTELASFSIPWPAPEDRERIADYLDRETGEIDVMLAKMDELTETLEARRMTAISLATSRGIDGATVVDSCNPYIGLVPKHWVTTRFGAEFQIEGGQVDPREEPWASMVLVAPNHIVSHRGQIVGRETARDQGADSGKYVARKGQILYSKIRPALNKVAIAQEDCLISADMYALSSRGGSDHRYLVYMLLSSNFHGYVSEISMRVKMPKVNREELSLAALALPPVDEQTRIADHLDEATRKIDQMLAKTAELKSLLIERRSALITEVVTGKKQVHS